MKLYAVSYLDPHVIQFDGDMCCFFSSKRQAIAWAKQLRDQRSGDPFIPNTWEVNGVYRVDVPTGKNSFIVWLNEAECRLHWGDQVWDGDL